MVNDTIMTAHTTTSSTVSTEASGDEVAEDVARTVGVVGIKDGTKAGPREVAADTRQQGRAIEIAATVADGTRSSSDGAERVKMPIV